MNRKSLFWELTLKLEAFTHTVPVPFAVYYAVITQKMETEKWVIFIALCVTFATGIGILGTIIRYFLINNLFTRIEKIRLYSQDSNIAYTYEDRDYAKAVKLYIFKYPLIESIIIVIRWFAGVIPILSLYTIIVEYTPSVIRSGIFTIAMIPPISFVTYYFITENALRPLFDLPQIRNVEIKPDEIPKFDYFKRIVLAFFSLAALPVSVLSYILYSVATGETMVSQPLIPIFLVSSIFIVPLIVCSYIVAKTVRQGLSETSKSLDELAKGNFDVVVTPTSGDDFGQQAFFLNNVIQRLRGMYAEIRGLNEGLEGKVIQRTEQLNQSLNEVQALKFQQDGDYFLTYQLIAPLGFKEAKSDKIDLEFFLMQKKTFDFKGINYNIGGDLNISHNIYLRDQKYVLFVNADAMGKSMQGAGGALVFGAVFQSIVQRTQNNITFQNVGPEQWLAAAFTELQRIFEAFDGTMLISLIMGLIEEKSGRLYFVNAEHPWPVLYRDEKASYILSDYSYHKLGTLGSNPNILVKTLDLKPGDVIIVGSDGKDDILIERPGLESEVNSDDSFFLGMVAATKAEPKEIYQTLLKTGSVIDDISMIRIEYLGTSRNKDLLSEIGKEKFKLAKKLYVKGKFNESIQAIHELIENEPNASVRLQKNLSKLYFQISDYQRSMEHMNRYLVSNPEDEEFLFFCTKMLLKIGKIAESLQIAEGLRLKAPRKIKYLIHLFQLYLKVPNQNKAREILNDLRILHHPEDQIKILEALIV
ncbi:stage II sporulation protein E [Leptospira ognonensis]|uniref:Stage II sporulation protein E n=1 Tax=Leptospira ognonensis TaxID=2484945 RepID=A0A4R9K212_9LEPT|nr:SpoIIE family protein phosphatase [Leptospira ognonensis]TGL59201.1 stage II sporulation protein E [Leptospira ognonensis]